MTKLKRDARAWAARIRMSSARIWAVVEGTHHDVPFYEGVLTDGAGISDVEFVQASDIEVDGTSAGGKIHALKLHDLLENVGGLEQENKSTKIDVLFFLDRDDDEYLGKLNPSAHISYTYFADVEAEIVIQSDLAAASSRAFSISRAEANGLVPPEPAVLLADLWTQWIALRLAAGECEWSDTRFAQPSSINVPLYGSVDASRLTPICARVRLAHPDWDEAVGRAETFVSTLRSTGDHQRLVKGKWLPSFIISKINKSVDPDRKLPSVSSAQLITICLLCIDFTLLWKERYADRFDALLSR